MLCRTAALALTAMLAACATRPLDEVTIHIFSNRPDAAPVQSFADRLEAAGFRHRIAYAATPGELEISESVIVHGDGVDAFNRAQELGAMLSGSGISARIERERHANHHFTAGHAGVYIYLPDDGRMPKLKVHAHLAGSCGERPVELFLRVDHSYRLRAQRWGSEYRIVQIGGESGDWQPSGSGYGLKTAGGTEWWLEPPLQGDPASQVYFIRNHPDFSGCRLTEPL
ncbi:MAG TPA: hypothetical protein VK972_02050 [Wenzhouxiangella sp.]|nr:hypothetical protein [Wenzhouxiangella sp.]